MLYFCSKSNEMKSVILCILMCSAICCSGQNLEAPNKANLVGENELRLSLSSLMLRNIQLQYERSLSKKSALVAGVSMIPKGSIPMKSQVESSISDTEMGSDIIKNAELGLTAFTFEFRNYFGKGKAKGFYLAPFYRHNQFEVDKVRLEYESELGLLEENFTAKGKVKSHTFGLLLGVKFKLSTNFYLDWWILGPHFGIGKGSIVGVPDRELTALEQKQVEDELEAIDIPMVEEEVHVSSNRAELSFDGNWGGLRSGLCIGFRF